MKITQAEITRSATAILHGILHHVPDMHPDVLERILARVVTLHRQRYEMSRQQKIAALEAENRAASLKLIERVVIADRIAQDRILDARQAVVRDAGMKNLKASLAAVPAPGVVTNRRPTYPTLHDDIRKLLAEQPKIQFGDVYRHFQAVYGGDFLTLAGFKYYWAEVRGVRK